MQMNGWAEGFYRISEWVLRIVSVNLLWIFFTLAGLGIFGVMPATIAMFTLIRKWFRKEYEFPVIKTFWQTYRQEFLKANGFGFIIGIFVYILYINLQYLSILSGVYHSIMFFAFTVTSILFIMFSVYFFPVYVHFDLKFSQYFKRTIILALLNLHIFIVMIVGLVGLYFLFMSVPGLLPFFSISVPAFFMMAMVQLSLKHIEWKQKKLEMKQDEKLVNHQEQTSH
ncbi:YesL family protein [Salipaludibacillus sp. HK11]|uniref:YesL family protein n=1 Tax=Salipaludibacillus sp. HK11 TaxID=3394320 RepID=UPI0039FD8080